MPRNFSALATPRSVTATVLCFSSNSKSYSAMKSFLVFGSMPSGFLPGSISGASLAKLLVQVGGLLGGAGDDQRGPRLVDEDVVDLVDDPEVVHADRLAVVADAAAVLDLLVQRGGHVVAQVVEAELGVGAVRDVGRVGGALLLVGLHVLQHADGEPEALVDRAHPLRVAAGQVVVDGDDVDALAGERVEHDGQRRRSASCPRRCASRRSRRCAAPCRRSSGRRSGACSCAGVETSRTSANVSSQQVVERPRRCGRARAGASALRAQLVVVEQLQLGLPRVDGVDALRVALELLGLRPSAGRDRGASCLQG